MSPYLIANPRAGGGRGEIIFRQALRLLEGAGYRVLPFLSEHPGQARELAAGAVREGAELVVACGGDGTINEVVNGLRGGGACLGIIPAGRGNDLARSLGIPRRPEQACAVLRRGRVRRIDTVLAGGRSFCVVAVLGLAARVTLLANQNPAAGVLPYLRPLRRALAQDVCTWLELEYDGGSWRGQAALLAVGNTRYCGGGLALTPRARPDDGLLDVCVVENVAPWRLVLALPSLLWGDFLGKPFVRYFRSRRLRVKAVPAQAVLADGDLLQDTPLQFRVDALSLPVLVPGRGQGQ